MNLWGLWIFQVPRHHDFSTVDWKSIDINQPFYGDGLDWSTFLVKDVESESTFDLLHTHTDAPVAIAESRFGAPTNAIVRTYAFGICTVLIQFSSTRALNSGELTSFGRFLDETSGVIASWLGLKGHIVHDSELTTLRNSCVVSMQCQPDIADNVASEIRKATETVVLSDVGGVSRSLVGNKFSLFHADSDHSIKKCLELFMRVHAYAAGMYRYERLMIRELARLTSGVRMKRRFTKESDHTHNGARLLRALWTHQFIAAPVNERQIQEGLWNLWDMKELTESVMEMSEKVSSQLGARRDQRRNELASRLNWIILVATLVQVLIAFGGK
jgi:hypothetical protein